MDIIGDTARQALTELRRLLGVLRGPSERAETAPAASLGELDEVLDQVRGAGLPVDFEVVGTPGPLSPGVDLTAYRIVQEALTNTIRHARAAQAAVRLCYEPGYVTVSVTDSGRGRPGRPRARRRDRPAGFAAGGIRARPGRDRRAGRVLRRQPDRRPDPGGGFAVTARLPSR